MHCSKIEVNTTSVVAVVWQLEHCLTPSPNNRVIDARTLPQCYPRRNAVCVYKPRFTPCRNWCGAREKSALLFKGRHLIGAINTADDHNTTRKTNQSFTSAMVQHPLRFEYLGDQYSTVKEPTSQCIITAGCKGMLKFQPRSVCLFFKSHKGIFCSSSSWHWSKSTHKRLYKFHQWHEILLFTKQSRASTNLINATCCPFNCSSKILGAKPLGCFSFLYM